MDNKSQDIDVVWYNSLQYRVLAIFLGMFILILITITTIARTIGEDMIKQQAYDKVSSAGQDVVVALEKRTAMASALVNSISRLATQRYRSSPENLDVMPSIMGNFDQHSLIAGGGIWPEPYAFDNTLERFSFFWGRDQSGELKFFSDYNLPQGNGYHREEWYVPTRQLEPGEEYWSKSYIDPYSEQPMVTISVPMADEGQFLGVATIDLKLEGLQALLEEATEAFGGYAFIVDRNLRFISFPDKTISRPESSHQTEQVPYILLPQLAQKLPAYQAFHTLLRKQQDRLSALASTKQVDISSLAAKLAAESYQITPEEGNLIAQDLLVDKGMEFGAGLQEIIVDDHLLQDSVFVSVITMPNTFWHIVTVMPDSAARMEAAAFFSNIYKVIFISFFISMLIIWYFIRNQLTTPIAELSHQLEEGVNSRDDDAKLIKTRDKGELGKLVHWFNKRTRQLVESQVEIRRLAMFDALTGLPNRRMLINSLEERLAKSAREHKGGALLFLDLDHFKNINDSLGHDVGDQMLIEVGSRFQKALRPHDVVARIGGDEFVVVVEVDSRDETVISMEAATIAFKLLKVQSQPLVLEGNEYYVTTSIGISLYMNGRVSISELLKQADAAMYHAKQAGRNRYGFFELDMQQRVEGRLRIEKQLRQAIDDQQLSLSYQPQVDLEGRCRSAEALVRWRHPEQDIFYPGEFIHIAEDSNLIDKLGEFVFNEACLQFSRWRSAGLLLDYISVNISPRQIQHGGIIKQIQQAISVSGISPSNLMVEVTEGTIVSQITKTIDTINELKRMGVKISIDDFGSGLSSLKNLKKLPLDQLKIDRIFIRDLPQNTDDQVIVKTIISVAKHFDLKVIAEGVETREQYDFLVSIGCTEFQGYYFSRPVDAEALRKKFTSDVEFG